MRNSRIIFTIAFLAILSACGKAKKETDEQEACGTTAPSVTNGVNGAEMGVSDTNLGGQDIAQSFTIGEDTTIKKVTLPLKLAGAPNPAAEVNIVLQKDNAGSPDNINVASAKPIAIQQINQNGNISEIEFAFVPAVELKKDTKYWLRMSTNLSANPVNVVLWVGHNGNPLVDGEAKFQQGVNWVNNAGGIDEDQDLLFQFSCEKAAEE